jgi:hypothetical protein
MVWACGALVRDPYTCSINDRTDNNLNESKATSKAWLWVTRSRNHEIMRSRDHEITRSWDHEVTRSWDHEVTRSRDHEITRSRGHEIMRSRGHEITRSWDHEITRSRDHEIMRSWADNSVTSFSETFTDRGNTGVFDRHVMHTRHQLTVSPENSSMERRLSSTSTSSSVQERSEIWAGFLSTCVWMYVCAPVHFLWFHVPM